MILILLLALDPRQAALNHLSVLESAMGQHLCQRTGPEHEHTAEARRNIAAGAVLLEPRVCYQERRGDRLIYRYRIVAVPMVELELESGGKRHAIVSWQKEAR